MEAHAAAAGDCCYLAGGQSLVPALSLRLNAPAVVIDISRLPELKGISLAGGVLRVGALTRHAEILTSPEIARHAPLLRMAAPFVAHPAIRNKGTFGGSIALADPAAEFPAMTLALDAEIEIAGPHGLRTEPATDFFRGLFETALAACEVITAIRIPLLAADERCVFDEYARRRGDYAMVGAGIKAAFEGEQVQRLRIAYLAVGPTPLRARHAEAAVTGRALSAETIADAQSALASDLMPDDTNETSAETRMHLARVLLGRLLTRLRDGSAQRGVIS
jgi:carbon-monoxide dehydrogenase medium subunit